MIDDSRMTTVAPAKLARKVVEMTLQWYLPESQKSRFLSVGDGYSNMTSYKWEPEFQMSKIKLKAALEEMKLWSDRVETDHLLESWDDTMLFFYVLRFQFVWTRLYTIGDETMIPYGADEFWDWSMVIKPGESWIHYTFPTVNDYNGLKTKPAIWGFFSPSDVPIVR